MVVHCKREAFDQYIGRATWDFPEGGIWGNPFKIGPDGSREDVVRKFRDWLPTQPHLMAQLEALRGKRLGCHCRESHQERPICHGDVYVELLEGPPPPEAQLDLF